LTVLKQGRRANGRCSSAPAQLREGVSRAAAWLLRLVGPPAAALAVPAVDTARALGAENVPAVPDLAASADVARQFAAHPWTWYSELLLAAGEHHRMDTAFVSFPVTLVGAPSTSRPTPRTSLR
jgi:hypothetical protein